MRHLILVSAAATALSATLTLNASAHAGLEPAKAAPGPYKAVLTVPHGCDGQATNTVRVEVPEGFVSVKPMPKPGWSLEVEEGDYAKPYKVHGRDVTAGAKAVTWSGGNLEDGHFDEFALLGTLADVEEGQRLFFKTTQSCESGEVAWVEIAQDSQNPHALEYPAPAVTILAAQESHAHHGGMDEQVTQAGDLEISAGYARAMLPAQPAGGAYLTITNEGKEADRLIGSSSPLAGKVEVHSMKVNDGVMTMRPVTDGLEIPAGETVTLKPGGLHLMFMQVNTPFKEGGSVAVTLEFEKAGKVELTLPVRAARGGGEPAHDYGSHGK